MMNHKDYVFFIQWEDNLKNQFKVGLFAKLDDAYYLTYKGKKEILNSAYEKGFIGIPGFQPNQIYKSKELFSFIKNRILDKEREDVCEELIETKGESMVDSFFIINTSEKLLNKHKQNILETYDLQEKKRALDEQLKRSSMLL